MGSLWSSARWTQTPPLGRAYRLALVITENISVHPIEQIIFSSEMNCWYVLRCQRQKNAQNLTCPALFIRRTCSCEAFSQSVNYTYSTQTVYFRVFSPHFSFIEKANWVTVLSSEMYNLKKTHINIWKRLTSLALAESSERTEEVIQRIKQNEDKIHASIKFSRKKEFIVNLCKDICLSCHAHMSKLSFAVGQVYAPPVTNSASQ